MIPTTRIRAVLLAEGEWWSAQCLEYDIAAQARSQAALLIELHRVLVAHILISRELGRAPFQNLPRAPQRYWDMFEAAEELTDGQQIPSFSGSAELPHVVPNVRVAQQLAA